MRTLQYLFITAAIILGLAGLYQGNAALDGSNKALVSFGVLIGSALFSFGLSEGCKDIHNYIKRDKTLSKGQV